MTGRLCLRNCHDRVHISRRTTYVHRHDASGPFRDLRLNLACVDLKGLWIGIHKNRQSVMHQDSVDGGDKRIRGNDDLVARADSDCRQRRDQRTCSIGDGLAMLCAQLLGPRFFETIRVVAIKPAPFPLSTSIQVRSSASVVTGQLKNGCLAFRTGGPPRIASGSVVPAVARSDFSPMAVPAAATLPQSCDVNAGCA